MQDPIERVIPVLERIAVANEQLIVLATEERDAGDNLRTPPYCPHCGRLDPQIRNEGGIGQFGEFILVAFCVECNERFLAVPDGWAIYKSVEAMKEAGNGISA